MRPWPSALSSEKERRREASVPLDADETGSARREDRRKRQRRFHHRREPGDAGIDLLLLDVRRRDQQRAEHGTIGGLPLVLRPPRDNIAGKAAQQIPHPSLTITDSIGRRRAVKIGGPDPDLSDDGCLNLPGDDFDRLVLLGDGDSDAYSTEAAMMRARQRHRTAGHQATIDWADKGTDFNTMLREARQHRQPEKAVA